MHAGDPIVWTLAPLLRAFYGVHPHGGEATGQRPTRTARYIEQTASAVLSRARPSGQRARYIVVGTAVFLIGGENERRSMEPILAYGGRILGEQPKQVRLRSGSARPEELTGRSLGIAASFVSHAEAAGVGLPCSPRRLLREFIGTARHMSYTKALVDQREAQAVVVGTNHSKHGRALLGAARRTGVPSVYVPHAPMLADQRFRDLPFDFAGLRGSAEVQWYRDQQLPNTRLTVVGDPGLPEVRVVPIPPHAPIVFAVAPYEHAVLRRLVSVIAASTPESVVVAPYPGQDLRFLRAICPPAWQIWPNRTYDLLRQGASAVVQHSSGVALEALLLGLPTIELSFDREAAGYPVIVPEYVYFAQTGEDLQKAFAAARADGRDERRRRRLHTWARTWCGQWGEDAAASGWSLVQRAVNTRRPPGPIWDAWEAKALSERLQHDG